MMKLSLKKLRSFGIPNINDSSKEKGNRYHNPVQFDKLEHASQVCLFYCPILIFYNWILMLNSARFTNQILPVLPSAIHSFNFEQPNFIYLFIKYQINCSNGKLAQKKRDSSSSLKILKVCMRSLGLFPMSI